MFKIDNLTAIFFTYFCPLFYGSPPSPSANTTSSTTATPWAGAAQYLMNGNSTYNKDTGMYEQQKAAIGPQGVYEEISNYAKQYSDLTPQQLALQSGNDANLASRNGTMTGLYNSSTGLGNKISGGAYDTHSGPVGDVNFGNSMSSMGAVDPTNAMSNVLRGDPTNNPYLAKMNQANVNTAMRGYNDAIQNVNQQVMPGINNDAFAAGQYGGSRQGIAQGLALQGMDRSARDLGIAAMDSGNQLYGSAFQQAQNNQAQAANQMTNYGLQNGQFNASLGLQNQTQQMAQNAQNMGNATTGNELNNTAATRMFAGQDQTYGSQMASANLRQQQKQDMLNMRLNALSPGANLGGSTTSTTPYYDNTLGNIGGLAAGAGGLISALKG
jgi:hypothetical protein